MTALQDWAIGLCATAFLLSIIRGVLPHGAAARAVTVLMSTVLFCCLLIPLQSIGACMTSVMSTVTSESTVSDTVAKLSEKQLITAMEQAMLNDATQLLSVYDLTVRSVEVKRDISQDGGIYITAAKVVIDQQNYPIDRRVYDVLEREWGIPVEVWYGE